MRENKSNLNSVQKEDAVDTKDIIVVKVPSKPKQLLQQSLIWLKHKKMSIISILLIAIIVIFGSIYGYLYYVQNRTVLQVGDQKISTKQYNKLLQEAKVDGVDKDKATKIIIEGYKYQQAAKQLNIEVSEDDIKSASNNIYQKIMTEGTINEWDKISSYPLAVKNNELLIESGGYKGAVFNFPFSGSYINARDYAPKPEGFGTQGFYNKTKEYAKNTATKYRDELISNRISIDTLIDTLDKDNSLLSAATANDSTRFYFNKDGKNYLDGKSFFTQMPNDIINTVQEIKPGNVSEVKIYTTDFPTYMLPSWASNPVETGYYFVTVTNKFNADPTIPTKLYNILDKIRVKT